MNAIDKKSCQELLMECYRDATRKDGLIEFTRSMRANEIKYSLTPDHLNRLFASNVWVECPKKGGHRKLQNQVTHVVIEYSNHDKEVDPGSAQTILDAVQSHLNKLSNEIFAKGRDCWKKPPDYAAAANRIVTQRKGP